MASIGLRWKKDPRETGLRAVGSGERGSTLTDGNIRYATVSAMRNGFGPTIGWYWVAGWESAVPYFNSCGSPAASEHEAKKAALSYVKEKLAAS